MSEKKQAKRWLFEHFRDFQILVLRSYEGVNRENVNILASGLVYSTLVAFIPCVTFVLSFLSVFGIVDSFFELLMKWLSGFLGAEGSQAFIGIISTLTSNAMGLGIFGLVSFVITALFLINKIYSVINRIFRTKPRTGPVTRFVFFLTFLIMLVVFLALIVSSMGAASYVYGLLTGNIQVHTLASSAFTTLRGFVIVSIFLFMLFCFVPDASINPLSALIGATFGSFSLMIAVKVLKLMVKYTVSYSVIYGSFASLFWALLFIYVSWYIILIAAELTYVHQFRPDQDTVEGISDSPSKQIADAVDVLMVISDAYKRGMGAVSFSTISSKLVIPPLSLMNYLSLFLKGGYILELRGRGISYVPSKPLDQIKLKDVFLCIFGQKEGEGPETVGDAVAESVRVHGEETLAQLSVENLLERV